METEEKTSEEMKNENGKNAMEPEEETNSGNSKKENEKNSTQREKISNNRYKIPPKNYKTFTGSRKLAPLNQSNDFSKGTFNLYYSQTMPNRKKENQTPKSELQTNEGLKEELRLMRLDLNKKTQELYELKIQFGKQLEENKNNKKLIETILKIDGNKPITKAEARDKIKYAKPTENDIKKLNEAYETIELKAEIQKCKKEYNDIFNELDNIQKNAKTSTIRKLNTEIHLNEENSRTINRSMKQMEKQISDNKEYIEYYKNQCEEKKQFCEESNKNKEEEKKKEQELENKRREKVKKLSELEEQIRKKTDELGKKIESNNQSDKEINNLNNRLKNMEEFNRTKEDDLEEEREKEEKVKKEEDEVNKIKEEREEKKEKNDEKKKKNDENQKEKKK
jgi:hypothetical protein